jgi:DNA replication licensing factor MCM5
MYFNKLIKIIVSYMCLFCRDTLKRNYNIGQYLLEVNLEDLASFNENLADKFYKEPTENHPVVSTAT